MSGTDDRDALAAEYVLGTLTAHEATRVAADPAMAPSIDAWERRLAPLTALALPESPPPDLWDRIEARIAPAAISEPPRRAVAAPRSPWLARLLGGWAVAATAAAAALIVLRPGPAPGPASVMTVMLTDRTQPAYTASFDRDGAIRLAAITPVGGAAPPPAPEDRAWQLWVLPPGATTPTSLGLLPKNERAITVQAPAIKPVPGMLIEITLEPQGGSPLNRPTGPVLFIGRLSQPGPNT